MILDATAGNRTMWKCKSIEHIIYLDIERKLGTKPTIFADNTNTPFLPGQFDTIFYDPPHTYGRDDEDILNMSKLQIKYAKKAEKRLHTYYGWKYVQDRASMLKLLFGANKEFNRILKNNGLLWLKWCELQLSIDRMLAIFDNFTVMMKLPVTSQQHTMGKSQMYWVCLAKIKREGVQSTLL